MLKENMFRLYGNISLNKDLFHFDINETKGNKSFIFFTVNGIIAKSANVVSRKYVSIFKWYTSVIIRTKICNNFGMKERFLIQPTFSVADINWSNEEEYQLTIAEMANI